MNLVKRIIRKVDDLQFRIPIYGDVELLVNEGDKVKAGQDIYKADVMDIRDSYYLPRLLAVKATEVSNFICRVSGEYITKGELIAERLAAGGLIAKRVIASEDGIVSTARLKSGYVDILAEINEKVFTANFKGEVIDITLSEGVLFKSKGIRVSLMAANPAAKRMLQNEGAVIGSLEVIKDGNAIYSTSDLAENYTNKILYAGRFLYADFAKAAFELDPKAVITYSMDYESFQNLDFPVFVIGGFGHIRLDGLVNAIIKENATKLIKISSNSGGKDDLNLDIVNGTYKLLKKSEVPNPFFKVINVGDLVKSHDVESLGFVGKVIDNDSERGYVLVENSTGEKLLVADSSCTIVA